MGFVKGLRARSVLGAMVLAACCGLPALAEVEYNVTDLGGSSQGGQWLGLAALNNNGQAVGYYGNSGLQAWEYSGGTVSLLPTLSPGNTDNALGINDSGTIAGSSVSASGAADAIVWIGGTPHNINPSGTASDVYSEATAVNNSGQIVGDSNNSAIYSAGGSSPMVALTTSSPGWTLSYASAINSGGQIAGTGTNGGSNAMFLLSGQGGTAVEIGSANNRGAQPWGMNNAGTVVGTDDNGIAFSWTSGGPLVELPVLGSGDQSAALGINDSGTIVGVDFEAAGSTVATIWQNDQITDLNSLIAPGAYDLEWAQSINESGQIVVNGTSLADGEIHSLLLTPVPVPEPFSMIYFGSGIVGVLGYVARRRMQKASVPDLGK